MVKVYLLVFVGVPCASLTAHALGLVQNTMQELTVVLCHLYIDAHHNTKYMYRLSLYPCIPLYCIILASGHE